MDWKILVGVILFLLGFAVYRSCSNDTQSDFDAVQEREQHERQASYEEEQSRRREQERLVKLEATRQQQGSRAQRTTALFETDEFVAEFTSQTASVHRFHLKNDQYLEHPRNWDTGLVDPTQPLAPINLVTTNPADAYWTVFPMRLHFYEGLEGLLPEAEYHLVESSDRQVTFRYEQEGQPVVIYKKYDLPTADDPYQFWLTVRIVNRSDRRISFRPGVIATGFQPQEEAASGMFTPQPNLQVAGCYHNGSLFLEPWDKIKKPFFGTNAQFTSVGNDYFISALMPGDDRPMTCRITAEINRVLRSDLQWGNIDINAGEDVTLKVRSYMGPKNYQLLSSVGANLQEAIDYGILAPICRFLLWLLFFFQSHVGNWGVAIILLTVVIKLALIPLTNKSFRSSNAMKALKPEMDDITARYKDNPQEKQRAIMALYKSKKINPLGGCLPMLLQMPIWFALFRMLRGSPELYRAPFFGWITDLSAADPYYVTPVVMGGMMFLQQRMMPMGTDNAQMKMMMYMMPIMFTVMMVFLPSGLTLYILVNTVLSILHQWMLKPKTKTQTAVSK